MWPWEHVVVGYLVYSAICHVFRRDGPRTWEAVLVVFASLLPDLIDKPLAWSFNVVSSGYGPAHSLFFVLPAIAVLVVSWWAIDRTWSGIAFATGYLLHLPSDVFFNAMDGTIEPSVVLWPVRVYEATGERAGFIAESLLRIDQFQAQLLAGDISTYTKVQLALMALAVFVWLYDGAPVFRESVSWTLGRLGNRF